LIVLCVQLSDLMQSRARQFKVIQGYRSCVNRKRICNFLLHCSHK